MQELMGGKRVYDGSGKYVHADHRPGSTQIAGGVTFTPSLADMTQSQT